MKGDIGKTIELNPQKRNTRQDDIKFKSLTFGFHLHLPSRLSFAALLAQPRQLVLLRSQP
jgi:hypothetical protein